jgi:thermostable 8-oxoguanine DNA glycosylase
MSMLQMKMRKLQGLSDLTETFIKADEDYNYQPQLTQKLDSHAGDFSEATLLEIVLWKTNRYPTITQDLLDDINELRKSYSEEKARHLLRKLLQKEIKGFDLPMASTVLRFAVPDQLQIIDQRVYRFITPDQDHLKIPHGNEQKIDLYFDYIKQLKSLCQEYNIPFSKADRILYQLDKQENKNIPLKTYA